VKGVNVNGERTINRRKNKETYGIVLGWSFIQEGVIERGEWRINETRRRKVYVIQPLTNGNRYIKPIRAYEIDLTIVGEFKNYIKRAKIMKALNE